MSANVSHRSGTSKPLSAPTGRVRGKKKQEWDSYVKDDSLYQLTKEQMLARKKLFVSKNNILAAELTPDERARIAARALRKERALHIPPTTAKKVTSLNRTKKGMSSTHGATSKRLSSSVGGSISRGSNSSSSKNHKGSIRTIYKAIDDIQEYSEDGTTTMNQEEELTVLDVLDHNELRNARLDSNHHRNELSGSDDDSDDDDTNSTTSTIDNTFHLHDNNDTKSGRAAAKFAQRMTSSNSKTKMSMSSRSRKVNNSILSKTSSRAINKSFKSSSTTQRRYLCNEKDRDQSYSAEEMQDVSDLLRSLVSEMKYYETVTGKCLGGGSFDSEELNAIIEDESSISPLNVKGAMLFMTQLVSQTMTHLLRSEIDLKVSREQHDMLRKRIENLELGVSGPSMNNDNSLNNSKKNVKFLASPVLKGADHDHSALDENYSNENLIANLSYDINGVSQLTRQDLSSMFPENEGDDTPIVANSSAANKILQQYAFGKCDEALDTVKKDDDSSYGEPAESDDGSELEASFTSENVNISTSSSILQQQHLMTGTSTSDWIFQASLSSPSREPNGVMSAATTYRMHQPSPTRVHDTSTVPDASTITKSVRKASVDSRWR